MMMNKMMVVVVGEVPPGVLPPGPLQLEPMLVTLEPRATHQSYHARGHGPQYGESTARYQEECCDDNKKTKSLQYYHHDSTQNKEVAKEKAGATKHPWRRIWTPHRCRAQPPRRAEPGFLKQREPSQL